MISGVKLHRVDTLDDAVAFMQWLTETPRPVLAIDTETTGWYWWTRDYSRLVQFGDTQQGWTLGVKQWWNVIEQAFQWIYKTGCPVVAHNTKYDMHSLRVAGFTLPRRFQWHDTCLMHTLLYPLEEHGLKAVCEKLVDRRAGEMGDKLKAVLKKNKWTWATVPYEFALYSIYGGYDTVLCANLFALLYPQIQQRFPVPYEIEMQAANVLYETERRGLRVDLNYCGKLISKYEQELDHIAGKLSGYGITKPGSNDQITAYLMENEEWEPAVFTDKGNIKFDKDVKEGLLNFEVVQLCSDYAQNVKWMSYISKMLSMNDNGIVYPSIKTCEARTSRMSIGSDKKEQGTGEPVAIPFQQLPHVYEARRPILPRHEGYVLRPIDYDSQEIRVLADHSGCKGLIEAILAGVDIHTFTAELITGEKIEKSDPRRTVFKMNRYLQVYGGGAEKLALKAHITVEEAKRFKEQDNQMFPEIKQFMKRIQDVGKQHYREEGRGYITLFDGRELEVEAPKKIDGELKEFWYKLANYDIQGTCAVLLKQKLIAIDSAGLTEYIDLPVHDELVTSVPNDAEGDEIAHEIQRTMEELDQFVVPLTCELSKGYDNWGQKYLEKGEVGWDEQAA